MKHTLLWIPRDLGSLAIGTILFITTPSLNAATPTGLGVLYEEFSNLNGTSIADLVSSPNYPNHPSTTLVRPSFEAFQNHGDDFGASLSGWIKAPETGNYTFWISSDDAGELRLSTDANPANAVLISSNPTYSNYLEWDKYPSQKSSPIALVAGQFYYIKALMKDGNGDDHLSVGWQLPSGASERPIPAGRVFLRPDEMTSGGITGSDITANKIMVNEIIAKKVTATEVVTTPKWRIPDYVFEKDYKMQSLAEVEAYVQVNKHLPWVPSAKEMETNGMPMGEMNLKLLRHVEELTLRMIEMDKEVKDQKTRNLNLERKVRFLNRRGLEPKMKGETHE